VGNGTNAESIFTFILPPLTPVSSTGQALTLSLKGRVERNFDNAMDSNRRRS
jgi:hypothetical protein